MIFENNIHWYSF